MTSEVYLLPLNDDGSPQVSGHEFVYLETASSDPIIVRFAIEGTSSICRLGSLWVNFPEHRDDPFQRYQFREFKLKPDFHRNIHIDIPVYHAGAYSYYVTYSPPPSLSSELGNRSITTEEKKETPHYYVDVAPRLELHGQPLPLEALSIFSLISKFMGQYPKDWTKQLDSIQERGYNMIHFTPLQERGESNSPYSIYDQLAWDPECFPHGIKDLVEDLKKRPILAMTDIVLNHTANNSKWLLEHPEAGYNLLTAPHLEAAYVLEDKLLELSATMQEKEVNSLDDLAKIMEEVKTECISKMKLWQYYTLHVELNAEEAIADWQDGDITVPEGVASLGEMVSLKTASVGTQADFLVKHALEGNGCLGSRYKRKLNSKVTAAFLTARFGEYAAASEETAYLKLRDVLNLINVPFYREYDADVNVILDQIHGRIRYLRLDSDGPRLGKITQESPLVEPYFTRLPGHREANLNRKEREKKKEAVEERMGKMLAIEAAEVELHDDEKRHVLANNGWVWGGNALVDNAGPQSKAYLLRQMIIWGDCVKLRYGDGPSDNPWLWKHMTAYACLLAENFDAFRIDNAHSTPLHVAEAILDAARNVKRDLYVVAELFTGSEGLDYVFVKRLGLGSLIREAMQTNGTEELSYLTHRYAGRAIGSFEIDETIQTDILKSSLNARSNDSPNSANGTNGVNGGVNGTKKTSSEIVHRIRPMSVPVLFMDCTHDNQVPAQKRTAEDTLPNAALVAMCSCATGSVMGYDEIYPRLLDLVNETRHYDTEHGGISEIRKTLNKIHILMGKEGYVEAHLDHQQDYITVHRVHPETHKGILLVARTAFPGCQSVNYTLKPVHLSATKAKLIGSWSLTLAKEKSSGSKKDLNHNGVKDSKGTKEEDTKKEDSETDKVDPEVTTLSGLPGRIEEYHGIDLKDGDNGTTIHVPKEFPPGSIALFETSTPAIEQSSDLDAFVSDDEGAFAELDLIDLNFLLYRCEAEERDLSGGNDGVYDIPGHGPLVYAGLQGWQSVLEKVAQDNNLGHPICQNLRDGKWALDFVVGRLQRISTQPPFEKLSKPADWFKRRFDAIRSIPDFLVPRYFHLIIRTAYRAAGDRSLALMDAHIREGQWFVKSLCMVSVQQTGLTKSSSLYPNRVVPSLAAGLPHFSVDWTRCWGRDVFISLRGLLLVTGRFAEAREHILAFASVMKHGMIPNLLSSGNEPRFNARDAVWFFLQCIQDYVHIKPNGKDILQEKVKRRFLPYDDTWFDVEDSRAYSKESTIADVIQEALQRHASGLDFREANAGPRIDSKMRDEGFNIKVHVDWGNGIVFGGNQFNCGTWMDKMGESDQAGSTGFPGTPRDGAAVEITGLLYSTIKWLSGLHAAGVYEHEGVKKEDGTPISFADWAALLKDNFERCYFVPLDKKDDGKYDVNTAIVNRRGIYKDLYRSGKEYEDYQLRPNFPIAMTVAPDLFDPQHAIHALCVADEALRGPMGMATLDPSDYNYRPYYVNNEDSKDFATSKGRNYHQGPEWLWPTGFFLRALLKFDLARRAPDDIKGRTEAYQQVTQRLEGCKKHIKETDWAGLPELTQRNGEQCNDSCTTQAWSAGCILDLYRDAFEAQISAKSTNGSFGWQ